MNIAVLSFYSGINNRGVERWVYELASRLTKKHKVTVFQNNTSKVEVSFERVSAGISYHEPEKTAGWLAKHLFIDYKSLAVFRFNLKIFKKLLNGNYNVVIPTDGGWESAIARMITWLRGSKMVIVGHAGIGWDDANNLWSFPDVFVALSSFAKKWAQKVNPLVRVKYIPDAVDLDKFKPDGDKLDLLLKKPVILCVGAFEKGKQQDLVIKAVAELKNFSLLLVGSGPLKGNLTELGNKLLGSRFKVQAFDFEKMPNVYRSCDLFVSASTRYYSFEMVLLEAMASGLAVVVNDDPIRREIIGDAGVFSDPSKTVEFSNAIKEAASQKWGEKPVKQAGNFLWEKIYKEYEDMFLSLLKGK